MKIGEAGEAFFVFETDDDVPDDLITSPLLQPTRPHEAGLKDAGVPTGSDNLGVRQSPDGGERDGQDLTAYTENVLRKGELDTQEPEFLDLDALPSRAEEDALANVDTTHKPLAPPPFSEESPQASMSQQGRPAQSLPSPPLTPTHNRPVLDIEEMLVQDKRVDEAIKAANSTFFEPEVEYRHGQWQLNLRSYELRLVF
jgi:phosphatidate phosphatase LPIN